MNYFGAPFCPITSQGSCCTTVVAMTSYASCKFVFRISGRKNISLCKAFFKENESVVMGRHSLVHNIGGSLVELRGGQQLCAFPLLANGSVLPSQNYKNMQIRYDYKQCIGLKVKPRQGDALLFYSINPNGTFDAVCPNPSSSGIFPIPYF